MNHNFDFERVFRVFKKYYKPPPLETFKKNRYKILVSTLLSSRTKDEVTLRASRKLFKAAPNIKSLSRLKIKVIEKLIFPVGFYKTKSKYLKDLANIIVDKYNSEIPKTKDELMSLPGVGRKTTNLVLNRAFNVYAIAVDTHVHRIANLLGWVKTRTPEQTEKELAKILPKKYWPFINRLFVSIGRQFTTKKKLEEFLKQKGLITK